MEKFGGGREVWSNFSYRGLEGTNVSLYWRTKRKKTCTRECHMRLESSVALRRVFIVGS